MKTPIETSGAKLSKSIRALMKTVKRMEKEIGQMLKDYANLRRITDEPGDRRKRKTFRI